MPNAIKKSNEEISMMLYVRLATKRALGKKLNTVQTRVYESVTRAAIADASAELFGA